MVRRTTGAALYQSVDPFVQLGIALDPDRIIPTLGFQQVEKLRDGKGRIHRNRPQVIEGCAEAE